MRGKFAALGLCNHMVNGASMRPARFAREIASDPSINDLAARCFNEARAFCAGNLAAKHDNMGGRRCFNEARAFCAGNCGLGALDVQVDEGLQ